MHSSTCSVPLRLKPSAGFQQQGGELIGSGSSVAVSADGNFAAVGDPSDGFAGATWVFERTSEGMWRQQGDKLVGTGAGNSEQQQGTAVAMSADGTTLAVGAWQDRFFVGATWVFTRSAGGEWIQQGSKLVGTGAIGLAGQGRSVALSADGAILAVGAPSDDNDAGATWVFERSSRGEWAQVGSKLVGTGASDANSGQGTAVALSADGATLVVGGPNDNPNNTGSIGATWVFKRLGDEWRQQGGKLVGSGVTGPTARQGASVALSADGTLAVGGNDDNFGVGATWIFTQSSAGEWSQQGERLLGTGGSVLFQGASVALSADGSVLAVGGTATSSGGKSSAGTFVFTRSAAGEWAQQGSVLAGTLSSGSFPKNEEATHSVALSASGTTLIVGFSLYPSSKGGTWVFQAGATPFLLLPQLELSPA